MAELTTGFDCRTCGMRHATLPLSFSVKSPHAIAAIPHWQRSTRMVITPDLCVIDNTHFYVRGRIVLPIHGLAEPFIWGVWAQASAKSFYRTYRQWRMPGRESEPPFRALLATNLSLFADTLGLGVDVHTQVVGRRPHFVVRSSTHPLGQEQRSGISLQRVEEIAALLLHPVEQAASSPLHLDQGTMHHATATTDHRSSRE